MTSVVFNVDPDGLDALRARLAEVEAAMAGIGSVSAECAPADLGADGAVWAELQAFHDDWSNGLAIISHNVNALLTRLAAAAQRYRATESEIASAADQGAS